MVLSLIIVCDIASRVASPGDSKWFNDCDVIIQGGQLDTNGRLGSSNSQRHKVNSCGLKTLS